MATLGEFSYSLDGSNTQTFQLERTANPQAVNMVRFDFSSNHGNLELTCIYRFRVHGTEPGSLSNAAWCPHLWAAHQSLKDYWIPFANQSTSSALRVLSQSVLGLAQEWMPEQKLKGIELVTSDCPHVYLARLISVVCTLSWIGPDVLYLARFLILVPLDRCTVPTLVSNLLVCNSGYTMPRLHCYSLQDWCI